MQNNKISIITPTYNAAEFIEQNLIGVHIKQDYKNIEHIIVDGGSSDPTIEIINKFIKEYSCQNIRLYIGKDKNMYDAINKGMQKINGDIWALNNSDDHYLENTFSKVNSYFTQNDSVDAIYGNYWGIDGQGKRLFKKRFPELNLKHLIHMEYCGLFPYVSTFFRKTVIDKVGYFDINYNYASDYDYLIRVAKNCCVLKIDEYLTYFRSHAGAISEKNKIEQDNESLEISKRYSNKRRPLLKNILAIKLNLLNVNIFNIPYILKKIFGLR
jgi:cellulose synthase/poly-beta-1,6-N-acetylglucosamine synthase-like glycosyltransferase